MQDGRCRLINRADLLVRLILWQSLWSGKTGRLIAGKNITEQTGRERRGEEGGRKVFKTEYFPLLFDLKITAATPVYTIEDEANFKSLFFNKKANFKHS